ncbi:MULTISPECIES: indolepyruvate oxidoreductase subunit beta [unclassified Caldicellulosiruptor]|uniref:indolepyruvate oxidoreductase subunit beta n=1 Tax=unclassified Caldicellulosiruptor TaxID=2622462 RepID=UPI0003A8F25F|nr:MULTISPECIES: indolepyruvate oxidoreductase subunit beta [unclassified Caldicellulosiruptor]
MSNILIAGVGGQGNIFLSRVICQLYMNRGYSVKTAENIGMSQRGGSVVSFVRIGSDVGPIIPDGLSDVLIGLEMCEALRNVHKLNVHSKIILNNRYIKPKETKIKKEEIVEFFKQNFKHVYHFDAHNIAIELGVPKAENIAMLSLICKSSLLPFSKEEILRALSELLPQKMFGINKFLVEKIYEKY